MREGGGEERGVQEEIRLKCDASCEFRRRKKCAMPLPKQICIDLPLFLCL